MDGVMDQFKAARFENNGFSRIVRLSKIDWEALDGSTFEHINIRVDILGAIGSEYPLLRDGEDKSLAAKIIENSVRLYNILFQNQSGFERIEVQKRKPVNLNPGILSEDELLQHDGYCFVKVDNGQQADLTVTNHKGMSQGYVEEYGYDDEG